MKRRMNLSVPHRYVLGLLGGLLAGAPQTTFADEGGFPCSDWGTTVLVDSWERTIVGGVAADNRVLEWEGGHAHYGDFAVARLRPDGSFDPSFGDRGSVILDGGDFDSVAAMAASWDGLIVAGTTQEHEGDRSGPGQAVIFKLDDRGRLVESFGDAGMAHLGLASSEAVASVAAGWFGAVYVAGTLEEDGVAAGFVARLDRSGDLDPAFGTEGVVQLADMAGIQRVHSMRTVAGGLLVAGQRATDGVTEAVVARLSPWGELSPGFGGDGVASAVVPNAAMGQGSAFFSRFGATAVSLQQASDPGNRVATVVFDRRGDVRPGTDGQISVLDAPTGTQDSANAGAFVWGRTMYLAGATYPDDYATGDAFLARKRASDANYDITSTRFDLEYAAYNDLAVSLRGLTAVGWNFGEQDDTLPPSDALVVRYRHDGSLDPSFGEGGTLMLDFMRGEAICGPRIVEGEHGHEH